ncbi:Uma2 family endonuclease [Kitasatospora sp. NPDC096147]|uniref:Uma2 family endonuclease n=1 Tax=Kitasatospora sp. NPDC096147 TaxID=3364093 RepID=UPI0038119E9F
MDPTLLQAADLITDRVPGFRAEVIDSQIMVTPLPDGGHAERLTDLTLTLIEAGLHGGGTVVVQRLAVRLVGGPADFAVPDLAVAEAGLVDEVAEYNCYRPSGFRLVCEVTSVNPALDRTVKPQAYAAAGIPVYLIIDREREQVVLLTDPSDGEYRVHAVRHRGQTVTLPASVGAAVTLSVDLMLGPVL